jgi:hypothetical protein
MYFEAACENGHPLMCKMRAGQLRGVLVGRTLRYTCPQCGAPVGDPPESGMIPVRDESTTVEGAAKGSRSRPG